MGLSHLGLESRLRPSHLHGKALYWLSYFTSPELPLMANDATHHFKLNKAKLPLGACQSQDYVGLGFCSISAVSLLSLLQVPSLLEAEEAL